MSAIVGIYHRDGAPVDRAVLQRMTDTLANRGPDGCGVEGMGPVGLGHLMLWTTPESLHESLPFVSESGELLITADARIDNREELLPALGLQGHADEGISDSQVILAAYEKWGEDCPNHLLGDFAFAIWDTGRQILFCARDHFGVKPLYYCLTDGLFAFGTEIKALHCLSGVSRRLNEAHIGSYLATIFDENVSTFYEGILRLPPAHYLTVGQYRTQLECYWKLDPSRQIHLDSDEEYAARFRDIFSEAVRCRLRSALPVGALLSGGLDSSSIASVAQSVLSAEGKKLATFSAVFPESKECDERPFIATVIDKGGIVPFFLDADALSMFSEIREMLRYQDEPSFGPGLYSSWALNRLASQQGVRILLDGHDGDSTVSHGFGYLSELARGGRWLDLIHQLRGLAISYRTTWWSLLWEYVSAYLVHPVVARSGWLRFGSRIARRLQSLIRSLIRRSVNASDSVKAFDPFAWQAWINPDLRQRLGLDERRQLSARATETERESHLRGLIFPGQSLALETLDQAAAAFGVEVRFPFWDKRLVEFCLALPSEQKLSGGWSRVILRRAMAGILPPEIQWRREKTDFTATLQESLGRSDRSQLETMLEDAPAACQRFVDVEKLHVALAHVHDKRLGGNALKILQPLTLLHWLCRRGLPGVEFRDFTLDGKDGKEVAT